MKSKNNQYSYLIHNIGTKIYRNSPIITIYSLLIQVKDKNLVLWRVSSQPLLITNCKTYPKAISMNSGPEPAPDIVRFYKKFSRSLLELV